MKYTVLFFLMLSFLSVYSQQVEYIDFKTAKVDVKFSHLKEKEVLGTVLYEFEVLKDIDSVVIDAQSFIDVEYILDNEFSGDLYNNKQLIVKHDFKAKSSHTLKITWKT